MRQMHAYARGRSAYLRSAWLCEYKNGGTNNRRMYGQARVVARFQDLYTFHVFLCNVSSFGNCFDISKMVWMCVCVPSRHLGVGIFVKFAIRMDKMYG